MDSSSKSLYDWLLIILLVLTAVPTGSSATPIAQKNARRLSQPSLSINTTAIIAANNAVATKDAVEEDFMTQLSVHMEWEHLLSPAPLSIGLLGDLIIMSSQANDFAIDSELPISGGIKYVKYPKSFRATLVQIANGGHRAFMVAHNNMDKIKLLTADVPAYMKEATRILVTGDEELVQDYLPAPLSRIRESAVQSVLLSKAVVYQFEHVMNLTTEVLEMCTSEKSQQEMNLRKNLDREKVLNITIPSYQQMVANLNETVMKDTAMMDRAEDDMRRALKEIPTGWQMIGMDFVQSMANMATSMFIGLGRIANPVLFITDIKKAVSSPSQVNNSESSSSDNSTSGAQVPDTNLCLLQHRKQVLDISGFARNMRQTYTTLESIDSAKGIYKATDDLKTLNNLLSDEVSECQSLVTAIEEAKSVANQLANLAKLKKSGNVTDEDFAQKRESSLGDLEEQMKSLQIYTKNLHTFVMSNQQAVPNKTPLLSRAQQANSGGTASQQQLANCRYRADMAQATLQQTRESLDKTRALMIEQNKEFIKLLTEQQSLKLDQVRYDEIIAALQEGLRTLGVLKEHWTKLVMFFQKIANIVEHVAAKSIEDFAKHIETTSQKLKHVHKEFVIDAMYSKALKATQATALVHNMATTYLDVSGKYIMPSVAILSRLNVIDPKMAKTERANLLAKCEEDSQSIVDLIIVEKEKVIRKIEAREAQIKKEYAFLDDIRSKQIEFLRQKTQTEMQQQVKRGKLNKNQLSAAVEQTLVKRIEDDEFLRENHVFNYQVNSEEVEAEEF
ncbi:uncharacterized protein LOC124312885 [Daphnia pulicaria]|uniref:uncharacterized protein LOC124312885 n=1 Tax=Daphnia pulicaria TaxID=35523 RepID=UPI001EEB2FF9|nr:uncharacterized protein LOC124312885 [Daphnia pulicaria]